MPHAQFYIHIYNKLDIFFYELTYGLHILELVQEIKSEYNTSKTLFFSSGELCDCQFVYTDGDQWHPYLNTEYVLLVG